jgi:ferric-dicitrate binding protein FerR (iron transport regulator)
MNDSATRLSYLLGRYAGKQATEAELQELAVLLERDWEETAPGQEIPDVRWGHMLETIKAQGRQQRPLRRLRIIWYRSAAAVLLLLGAGAVYYSIYKKPQETASQTPPPVADVLPGGNKAVLTLSGGRQIILDSARQGDLVIEGNAKVSKLSSGRLNYRSIDNTAKTTSTEYNTLSTPRGGQYQLTLADGTVVWLNAASSITYPTTFTGSRRDVAITGEAYFEVKYKASQPFRVTVGKDTIEDLGTHFNINAYSDEPALTTTLLEGRVRVDAPGSSVILEPGQRAISIPAGSLIVNSYVDLEEAIAWKNGMFQFNRADIQTVMRQIARWYNVEVRFEGAVSDDRFWGKLPRDANVSQVLHVLQKEQIHFRIEGKTIIVTH